MIKSYAERYHLVKATLNPDLKDIWRLMKEFKEDPKLREGLGRFNLLEEIFLYFSKMINRVSHQKLKPGSQEVIKFYERPGSIKQIKKALLKQSSQNFIVPQPSVPVFQKPLEKSTPSIQPLRAPKRFERMSSSSLRSEALKLMQHYPKECTHSKRLELVLMFYFLLKELSDRYFYNVRQSQLPRYPNFSKENAGFMVQLIEFINQNTQQLSPEIEGIQRNIETIGDPLSTEKIQMRVATAFVLLNADLSIFYLGLMNAGFVLRLGTEDISTLLFFHLSELQALKKIAQDKDLPLIRDAIGNVLRVLELFKISK